ARAPAGRPPGLRVSLVSTERRSSGSVTGPVKCTGTTRAAAGGGVASVHGQHHVRRLDDHRDVAPLGEAKLADRPDGDRRDEAVAGDVHLDVGDGLALADARDPPGELVACADPHRSPPSPWTRRAYDPDARRSSRYPRWMPATGPCP